MIGQGRDCIYRSFGLRQQSFRVDVYTGTSGYKLEAVVYYSVYQVLYCTMYQVRIYCYTFGKRNEDLAQVGK